MLTYVDKVDSAQLIEQEILNPTGWVLLGFLCDPRTGLGYHKKFRISNLAWVHGLNGLRIVLTDYIRRSGARRIVFGAIGLFGFVWFVAGAAVLFYVQQNAAAMLK